MAAIATKVRYLVLRWSALLYSRRAESRTLLCQALFEGQIHSMRWRARSRIVWRGVAQTDFLANAISSCGARQAFELGR